MLRNYTSPHVIKLLFILLLLLSGCQNGSTASNNVNANTNLQCGTVAYPPNTKFITPNPIFESSQVWHFASEPNLYPMKVAVNTYESGTASGFTFIGPFAQSNNPTYGQTGALILEDNGNPIWFRPLNTPDLMNTNFRMQKLYGNPVLTFWQGTISSPPVYTNIPPGSSESGSCYYILDNSYNIIQTVNAQNGYIADVHEFLITPNNTAIFTSTKIINMDLTPYGGPEKGAIQDFAIQEVDLATGKLLFFWSIMDHVPLTDSYELRAASLISSEVWDAYHMNGISLTDNADELLVSARNTWAIYKINKTTGNIVWHLGGKQNDFILGPGTQFAWQHNIDFISSNVLSMFNDNCCEIPSVVSPGTLPSHGMELLLDFSSMTATLKTAYYHDQALNVFALGNMQNLDNGNKFIGWGWSTYYSEYAGAGNNVSNPSLNMLYDASMPGNNMSYRTFHYDWVGTPYYPPSIAVKSDNQQNIVYASWNGSTETKSWQIYAGSGLNNLSLVKNVPKAGFETTTNAGSGQYFQVKALDINGKIVGTSAIVKASTRY